MLETANLATFVERDAPAPYKIWGEGLEAGAAARAQGQHRAQGVRAACDQRRQGRGAQQGHARRHLIARREA